MGGGDGVEISDPLFREAVAAVDGGDVAAVERLVLAHPRLVRDRVDAGDGYFARPYLLWFVADNPVRNGRLPPNIAAVTSAIIDAARRDAVASLGEQLDYALALVCSGRVVRECGVQRELIDLLVDSGANPNALVPALAHREIGAAERLLERGAELTLLAAVCTGRTDAAARLAPAAAAADRQLALAGAALYGRADMIELLVAAGVDVAAYSPPVFHPHGTALHHAVDSGSLAAVEALVTAGAPLDPADRIFGGTPVDWADHLERGEIADYLRASARRSSR
jgi:peptide-methionine (S)-S-oxide reductase